MASYYATTAGRPVDGRLAPPPSSLSSLPVPRGRDALAIATCLLLLRLAFMPPSSTGRPGLLGDYSRGSSGSRASLELAFYAPFVSRPPDDDGGGGGGSGETGDGGDDARPTSSGGRRRRRRTAMPVPLDVDGDGVYDSIVVPAYANRDDVLREREAEESSRRRGGRDRRRTDNNDVVDVVIAREMEEEGEGGAGGWDEDGSWGLRVLDLGPLRRRGDATMTTTAEIAAAGPFVPRTTFLSPLRPRADGGQSSSSTTTTTTATTTTKTYPVRLLSVQVPVQRTRLGEEERSRQRHRKEAGSTSTSTSTSTGGTSGTFGKNSAIPAKDSPAAKDYNWKRHYFCGRDWHHAAQSCHRHCGGGLSSECGDGETCYADTPCDAHMELDPVAEDKNDEETVKMALTKGGTLPGVVTVWSDGSVTLHVVTADVAPPTSSTTGGGDGHRAKRARQRQVKRPELELRQLWRVYPLERDSRSEDDRTGEDSVVDFVELGIAFESGAIYDGVSSAASDKYSDNGQRRFGDNGAIILGGRYTLLSKGQLHPMRVSFHALDAMTGTSLWDLKGNQDPSRVGLKKSNAPPIPIIHTTSSARRRSHLPTTDALDPELDNENAFVEGDDVMTSEECMAHFRASVLDGESGALPHEFWDDGELGSISVGRFDRSRRSAGKKRKEFGKKGLHLLNKGGGRHADGIDMAGASIGQGMVTVGSKGSANSGRRGPAGGESSWQSDLIQRAVPRRLIKQLRYDASHPHTGRPNVVLFHGREGLAVLSLKNGRPVCHVSLMDHSLYADMDQDGSIDTIQVVTSPETSGKSSAVTGLIHRFAAEASKWGSQPDAQVICHALVTSGLPPREEVFTAPLCLGGPMNPSRLHVIAAPPLLVEGSMGYGSDVVFAMNNGVVVREGRGEGSRRASTALARAAEAYS
ncbi:hypothetical protein ACHAW5_006451 [Stephanodiscus triporus]|uniref:Uncharacterized protein n=1 Tax=Stephanodiscus triporus TaxID=2934178 RepID=A0ABD3NVR4_9STRA